MPSEALREKADWVASQMPEVVAKGGVFDDNAWHPVLQEAGIEINDTAVFQVGRNNLVIVADEWLIEPAVAGGWRVREWLGTADEHYAAALDDEAVDEPAGGP